MKNLFLFFLPLFLVSIHSNSQETIQGEHPNGQNWKILKSPAVDVVYPDGMEYRAQRAANIINYIREHRTRSVGDKAKHLNVLMQNRSIISNGFVSLGPFRSEFYSTPPQSFTNFGSIEFSNLLPVHEYRHALQFSNARVGLSKFFYYLQGEQGWSLTNVVSLPNWYFEGDAVVMETSLSESGRGRLAAFTTNQRTIALEGKSYRYSKIRNGSFKDQVPDHYRWGYMMMTHLRNEKDNDLIKLVLKDAASYRHFFYPFSKAMKQRSGLTTKGLYQEAWQANKSQWTKEVEQRVITKSEQLTDTVLDVVTTYNFPQYDENGNVYAWKTTNKRIDHIVKIRDTDEEIIFHPGINTDRYFNIQKDQIVYTELNQNPRRNAESFNDIYRYDLAKNKKYRLSTKGRYYSPILNPDANLIYAIELGLNLQPQIVSFDLNGENRKIVHEFADRDFISRINFVADENALVYILQKDNQLSIWKLLVNEKKTLQLSQTTHHMIDAPRVSGEHVYFVADFDQIDEIYRVGLDGSMNIEKVNSAIAGAYDPDLSPDGKKIIYKEAIFNGDQISLMNMENALLEKKDIVEPVNQVWQDQKAAEAEGGNIFSEVPNNTYETDDYKGLLRGFRIHSWPLNNDFVSPAVNLNFQNYLGEIGGQISAGYNTNEDGAFVDSRISYAKYFPVFSLLAGSSSRETDYLDPLVDTLTEQNFNQVYIGGEVSVPLTWYAGNFVSNLNPKIGFARYVVTDRKLENTNLKDRSFNLLNTGVNFSYTQRTRPQQIAPRYGLAAVIDYSRNADEINDERFSSNLRLYLPGLFRTHSLQFSGGFQRELLSNDFQQEDRFQYSRGFETPINDEFTRLSVDYGFPLTYPDWGIWGISYFKRIRMNLFADYGEGEYERAKRTDYYSSIGAELIFDVVAINLLPFSFGIRTSALQSTDPQNRGNDIVSGIFLSGGF